MTESDLARAWREKQNLSRAELSALTGYSQGAIFLFERGINSEGKEHDAAAWRRYKLACLAVSTLRHYQVETIDRWEWV